MRGFVEEIVLLLDELRNITWVLWRMIDDMTQGWAPDPDLVDHFYNFYAKLVTKKTQIHREFVVELYLAESEPYEAVEEITMKLFELSKEYEKAIINYAKAEHKEKIEILKKLSSTIKKYIDEIETLLIKLEEEVRAEEEAERMLRF